MKRLCFVLMPFGTKPGPSGGSIDFDSVYTQLLRPAIEAADLECIRADEEMVGGIIHKPMFERLRLCEFAVADLTIANANVFYELGVRHAVKPHTTALVFADGQRLPFDIEHARGLAYSLDGVGKPVRGAAFAETLRRVLVAATSPVTDSPIYQLLGDWPELAHTKTDVFRERVQYEASVKHELSSARRSGSSAEVQSVERRLGRLSDQEAGVVIDLLLSYRAVSDFEAMCRIVEEMPIVLRSQTLVREQYGFALNRCGRRQEAQGVLEALIDERGVSPETNGILGRVFKDRAADARALGSHAVADGFRNRAIEAYLRGFEADWRDAYPGVNAVSLLHEADPNDSRLVELVPVVAYALRRKVASGAADYWDYASLVELAIVADDETGARQALPRALSATTERWMLESTATQFSRLAKGSAPWVGELAEEFSRTGAIHGT